MSYSKITIDFNEHLENGSVLKFSIRKNDNLSFENWEFINVTETWGTARNFSNTVETSIIIDETLTATKFAEAFELDYNQANEFNVQQLGSIVEITTNFQGTITGGTAYRDVREFVEGDGFLEWEDFDIDNNDGDGFGNIGNPGDVYQPGGLGSWETVRQYLNVDFSIENDIEPPFYIESVRMLPYGTNPCESVIFEFKTVGEIQGFNDYGLNIIDANTARLTHLRGNYSEKRVVIQGANGVTAEANYTPPPLLSAANITEQIAMSPTAATVTLSVSNAEGLNLTYARSEEGQVTPGDFQSSNVFNTTPGNYRFFVRDQFGCVKNKNVSIDESGIQNPFFYISKSNSIRYANRIPFNNNDNFKTLDNTLSHEAEVPLARTEIQQFQSNDVITTQFKSNYSNISASVTSTDPAKTWIDFPEIEKKTNNIGLKDKRDARMISIASDPSKSGIYFLSGNIYDFDSGADTGLNYALNGALPSWGKTGNYIQVDNSWFVIEDVLFDEEVNADLLIISNNYTGAIKNIQCACIYNKENYEVYEFTLDMARHIDQQIRISIYNNDVNFDNLTHESEIIDVRNTQKETVEIKYSNQTNTDILFSTGIIHKIRIPINRRDSKPKATLESNETDTSTILLRSQSREVVEFTFHPVTTQLMQKLCLALIHESVQINGEFYVCEEAPEVEGALEETNLYIVKAKMIKTNNVYNNQLSGESGSDNSSAEIPNLIQGSDGFIKY